jgi:putative hydrolase of the HAD superfamily
MKTEAVFLDALGTLVELEPPWPHLAAALAVEPDDAIVAALRTEMAYYREHAHEAVDAPSLAQLRESCAALLSRELGRPVSIEALLASIRFRAFPDAAPALTALRARGLRLVCVSNWDYGLPEVLEQCGLAALLDGAVSSAAAGARKPDPAIFGPALEIAGCPPAAALHVGDTPDEDVAGARAAGIPALLIDRDGGGDVASLAEIEQHLRA